jgi:hypothetical protein
MGKTDNVPSLFLAYKDAFSTQDALIGIIDIMGACLIYGKIGKDLPETLSIELNP